MMRLIETSHLQTWASSKPAESRFPYIVKALICAVIQPEKLRMPSGDAVWLPGFDGTVVNTEESRFVPIGLSVWELSTNGDFRRKAKQDYQKRTNNKTDDRKKHNAQEEIDRSLTTFVFVTPLVWPGKDQWVAQRKNEDIWKDIWVIDGVDLQDWLEEASAIHIQFAAEMGIVPEIGLQTLGQAWDGWSHLTAPPTSEELVAIGREEQERELISRLSNPPSTVIIRGESPREALGFALSVMRRMSSADDRFSLAARTIVANNEDVAGRLVHRRNLIIILKQINSQISGVLASHGCHLILCEGNDKRSERNVIELVRPSHRPFMEALVKMGLSNDEAERKTRACGLSVAILQRQMAHANIIPPGWSIDEHIADLVPALLAGRWNARNEADLEALRRLANVPDYLGYETRLNRFRRMEEPPLRKIDDMWTLTAPADAFQLIARTITRPELEQFKNVFREVFGKIDPKVEIPPDDWIYADIKKEPSYSDWLRSGMAETLLLIAERGESADLECVQSPRLFAEEVVRGLPGLGDDWRIMASLRDQYARLMEATPNPFLDNLEQQLEAKSEDVLRLFAEGQGAFSGSPMYTGLLWGLETLAWSPEYLPRVALILASLANLDPGGRLVNRPINSLQAIFLWWYPCTNASIETKVQTLDLIVLRYPEVGWSLLAKLIPEPRQSISHGTAEPRWRDFGDIPDECLTRAGQFQYASAIVDRALEIVGSKPERWKTILDSVVMFQPYQQDKGLAKLKQIGQESLSTNDKTGLWELLRDFTQKHRIFHDADWTLSEELVERLEWLLPGFAPDDPVERNRWLFDEWSTELPSVDDINDEEKSIEQLRQQAVREILAAQGLEGLVKLGSSCKYPGFVAFSAATISPDLEFLFSFLVHAIAAGDAGVSLAGQISGQAQRIHGDLWSSMIHDKALAGSWRSEIVANILIWWPDERKTWEEAEALGVRKEYWRLIPFFSLNGGIDDKVYQIECLIEAGRAAKVFQRVAIKDEGIPIRVLLNVFDATINELARAQTDAEIRRINIDTFHVFRFLSMLRNRGDLPRENLARREYQVLPLLGYSNVHGLTIQEFMAEDPNFFIELLSEAFLPHHRDKSETPLSTPEAKARATASFLLLKGMDRIPGTLQDGHIDEETLLDWIGDVRKKAAEVDREIIADQHIGQILAHASEDPEDNAWPNRIIRNVIDRLAVDEIDRGLIIERQNMRGVFSKALFEGGAQERVLAEQCRKWAAASQTKWPRISRILVTLAQCWEAYAHQEDLRAEQEKLE